MKRIISILMSLAMVLTMFTGLNLSVYADDIESIGFHSNSTLEVIEDLYGHTETDSQGQDYFVYEINGYDLIEEGNTFTIYFDDDMSEEYECVRDYYNEDNDEDYNLVYKCGETELNLDDIEVVTEQDENNKWTVGNTYTARVRYRGVTSDSTFNVRIEENPVDSVTVSYDRPITLVENTVGFLAEEENPEDNWFFYFSNNNYLNDAGVSFTVNYKDTTSETYTYLGNDWLPKNENNEELNEKYLDFSFNQMRAENHFHVGDNNRTAKVKYYGYGIDNLPVNIVSADDDFDSGSISENDHRKVLFIGSEWHKITFTPEEDGVYLFEESLADKIVWERERFDGGLLDENGDAVDSLSNEWLAYVLEGGKEYTLKARKTEEGGPMFEFLHVKNINSTPVSVNFIPNFEYYTFYDGNRAFDDSFYQMGNKLEVTFSDGDQKTFVCNNVHEYRYYGDGEYGDEGIKLRDYAYQKDCGVDCEPRCNIDAYCWEIGGDKNYLDVYVGTAYQRYDIDDLVVASPLESISFSGDPIEVYYGTSNTERTPNARGEWVDYQRYDINKWDLEQEGYSLTVTYPDDTTKTYTCVEDEEYGYLEFRDENGETIWVDEFILDDKQGPENEWQNGETYDIDVYFRGQKCTFSASVVDSPVASVNVDTDGSVRVFENCNGHEEYDNSTNADYFRYDEHYDYLRSQNAVITVDFTDGSRKVYDFSSKDWIPRDENGERIDERYFNFRFDQNENHFTPDGNNKAYVEYYGVASNAINVNVIASQDIYEGDILNGDTKPVLFLNGETHTFTFTPDNNGVYEFFDSLINQTKYNDNYTFSVTDSNDEAVNPLQKDNDDDSLYYNLTADEEYTVTARYSRQESSLEYLAVRQRASVKKIEYTHAGGDIYVSEGDYGSGREIYDVGSTLTVTFSDGTVETFTANDEGDFRNNEGKQPRDVGYDLEIYRDCDVRITASAQPWVCGTRSYYTVSVGNVNKKVYVTVNASAVESITYHSKNNPVQMTKDVDFGYRDWEDKTEIYKPPFFDGDTVEVVYNDERGTVTYKHDWENRFYRYNDGNREEIYLNYTFNDSRYYAVGDEMEFTVSFQTGSVTLNAEVVENDVDHIAFTAARPYSVYKENRGWWEDRDYWDELSGENIHENFFHYDTPGIFKYGNVITVYYTDGTSAAFEYNGRYFMDEDGNRLDNRYLYTSDRQWSDHWTVGGDNIFYAVYKEKEAPVSVMVTELGEWQPLAWARDSRGNTYNDGDTLFIEKGQQVFVYFETDPRNREHNVTDFVDFSDGDEDGTLSAAGFRVDTHEDGNYGTYSDEHPFGFDLSSNNLRVGKTGTLNYYVYEHDYDADGDDFSNVDFSNTPHAADFSLNVQVVDHIFTESAVVPATCTTKGYTEYTCTLCGVTYRTDFTDYAEHDYIATVTASTPNTKGYTTYSCANCDYAYIADITGYASDDDALMAVVNNSSCLARADYSAASFDAFEDAVNAAQGIQEGENPQVEIDNATSQILTAITDLQPYLNFSVEGEHGTVTQSVENGAYLQGQEIALAAAADNGYAFGGWYEKGTKRIFSTDSTYTFVLTSNTEFVALFVPQGTNSLVFTNKTGQLVETINKTAAEWAEVDDVFALAPAVPYSYGCTNGAWNVPDDALTKLRNGDDVVIVPSYDESEAFTPEAHADGITPAVNLWYTFDDSNNVGSFVMAVDIPEGVTVESIGTAFYCKKADTFNPTSFILTVNNKTATSKFDDLQGGVYVTNMNKMSSYYNWAVRGYVNYYDGAGNLKTAYSQQINIVDRAQI